MTVRAPTNVQVSINTTDGDKIDVEWVDVATNEDGYRVYVSNDQGLNWAQDSGDLSADTESYTTTALLDGERYWVEVRAFDADGEVASEEPGVARFVGEYGGSEAGRFQYGGTS